MSTLTAITALFGTAYAQTIDGLYQPSGASWSCQQDQVGTDGGALAIQNGIFDGVENRCELTEPISVGSGISYTAVCSAEGDTYRESLTITSTANGVKIEHNNSTAYWQRCDTDQVASQTRQSTNTNWGYSDRSAYITSGGNHFALSCDVFNPSSTYPTASMDVPCPLCFPRETTSYTLQVDDIFMQAFDFERVSNAEGSKSDLDYYPNWQDGLVPALMSGTSLNVLEAGNVIATFLLAGSSRAIGTLRTSCN
jgi:hypothetical protein